MRTKHKAREYTTEKIRKSAIIIQVKAPIKVEKLQNVHREEKL